MIWKTSDGAFNWVLEDEMVEKQKWIEQVGTLRTYRATQPYPGSFNYYFGRNSVGYSACTHEKARRVTITFNCNITLMSMFLILDRYWSKIIDILYTGSTELDHKPVGLLVGSEGLLAHSAHGGYTFSV